jgi:hypothetical protein
MRAIGERSDAVLRTALSGHDGPLSSQHSSPPLEHQHMHAFEHDLIALVGERDGEANDAAVVALRFDRKRR